MPRSLPIQPTPLQAIASLLDQAVTLSPLSTPVALAREIAAQGHITTQTMAYLVEHSMVRTRPETTRDELLEVARRDGRVQWHPSGIVERLHLVNAQDIQATNVDENGHEDAQTTHILARRPYYYCLPLTLPVKAAPAPAPPASGRPVAWSRLRA